MFFEPQKPRNKDEKTIVKKLKLQNHIKHLWKKIKAQSLSLLKGIFRSFLIRLELFNRFECTTTKLFEIPKANKP